MATQVTKVPAQAEMTAALSARGDKWVQWSRLWVETLPVSYWVIVALAVIVVALEQALEQTLSVRAGSPASDIPVARFVLPGLTLYMLFMLRTLKRRGLKNLRLLRPSVKVDDQAYDDRVYHMVHIGILREFALLLGSAAVVIVWLLILHRPMPLAARVYLPSDPALAVFIIFSYTLFGWIGLNLLFATVESGRWLGNLSHEPLVINPFDPTNLLPFGNLAVLHSLTAAGVLLILLIGLGRPGALIDWLVIFLASGASLSALLLPLLGVHAQMKDAKTKMLMDYHTELLRIHDTLQERRVFDKDEMGELSSRTMTITNLRKTVIEAPNWPFQNTVTTSRAVLVATSPLIYFILTELIRVFLAPLLQNP